MRGRLTLGLALLRTTGCAALLLLIWNPISSRWVRDRRAAPRLVLLDASLSLTGRGGRWREALDSARALAAGGVIWRFGARITAFDSSPPTDGASHLAPALAQAAARGGPVAVVTDGAIDDVGEIPRDVLRESRVVVLSRPAFPDAFVAAVEGAHRVGLTDTLPLTVSYGVAGRGRAGAGSGTATLVVQAEGRRLASREVPLPDSGTVSTELTLPASRLPHTGWTALEVRIDGASDSEPRDDARLFVVEASSAPPVVVLAAPPDWDVRFLARTLAEVAGVPLKMFLRTEPGADARWRDGATLQPVTLEHVRSALARARLVVKGGDPAAFAGLRASPAELVWLPHPGPEGEGDWYVGAPPVSVLTPALAGVAWDSLPPATALVPLTPETTTVVALSARLARRGPARPAVLLSESAGGRRVAIAAAGLYRWAFRGGASAEAYRALVASLADWLLQSRSGRSERVVPTAYAVPNGMPLLWRWTGAGTPRDVVAAFTTGTTERRDTLRFDASGQSELWLPPGVYRYTVPGGPEQGMVAVETYSDEWRPAGPVLRAQPGGRAGQLEALGARDRGWLFVLAIAAFAAEWAWRRRAGLP